MSTLQERILYEDNHLIIVNKLCGEIVQADKTGDRTLADEVREYLKQKYSKPGNVYLGIPHRLDRPTSGIVVLCRTEKALSRMNAMFRDGGVDKTYWAVCDKDPGETDGRLEHWIKRNEQKNISRAYDKEVSGSQKAVLEYKVIGKSDRYELLQIHLLTGRHHQIRAQLAACGVHIKGDLKYGFPRSNPDGGICLHSRHIEFVHPVRKEETVCIKAPVPENDVWRFFSSGK